MNPVETMTSIRRVALFCISRLGLLCAFGALAWPFSSQASELSAQLESPGYLLLVRHTRAPGIGDPANFKLDDCSTQRNLSAEGKHQAVVIGAWLKKQGIPSALVYSSPWCRCKDTAQGLDLGGFQVAPVLSSFFVDMKNAKQNRNELEQFIAQKMRSKHQQVLILVTHEVNIAEFIGESVAAGEMALVQVDGDGRLISYRLIPRPE